jgi:hypothetical protein
MQGQGEGTHADVVERERVWDELVVGRARLATGQLQERVRNLAPTGNTRERSAERTDGRHQTLYQRAYGYTRTDVRTDSLSLISSRVARRSFPIATTDLADPAAEIELLTGSCLTSGGPSDEPGEERGELTGADMTDELVRVSMWSGGGSRRGE